MLGVILFYLAWLLGISATFGAAVGLSFFMIRGRIERFQQFTKNRTINT